jgi:hypothetical protein
MYNNIPAEAFYVDGIIEKYNLSPLMNNRHTVRRKGRRRLPGFGDRSDRVTAGTLWKSPFGTNYGYMLRVPADLKGEIDKAMNMASWLGVAAISAGIISAVLLNPKTIPKTLALMLLPPIIYTEVVSWNVKRISRNLCKLEGDELIQAVKLIPQLEAQLDSYNNDYDLWKKNTLDKINHEGLLQGSSVVSSTCAGFIITEFIHKGKYAKARWFTWIPTLLVMAVAVDNVYRFAVDDGETIEGAQVAHFLHFFGISLGAGVSYYLN